MQQNPDQNINPINQNPVSPQNPQVNPSNQTFINTAPVASPAPVNNTTAQASPPTPNTPKKIDSVEKIIQVI